MTFQHSQFCMVLILAGITVTCYSDRLSGENLAALPDPDIHITGTAGMATMGHEGQSVRLAAASQHRDQSLGRSPTPFFLASQKGSPIFLPKPPEVPPPTVVGQRMIPEKYDDGSIKIEREVRVFSDDSIENHGSYIEYYANGQKFMEGRFDSGFQEGEWNYWYDNGQVCKTISFKKGVPDGKNDVFRKDGTRLYSRSYQDGKKQGTWLTYADDGELVLIEQNFTDGKADGVWITKYPDGKKQTEISFKGGERDGTTSEWDQEGNLVKEYHFVNGKRHGTWMTRQSDGSRVLEEYQDGELKNKTIEKQGT